MSFSNGDGAELRGRTYASIYSPVNATYKVESAAAFFHLSRRVSGQLERRRPGSEHAEVLQIGDNFKAEIFVPVWTSQLYVSDWWQIRGDMPLDVSVAADGQDWSVTVNNLRDRPLCQCASGHWRIVS